MWQAHLMLYKWYEHRLTRVSTFTHMTVISQNHTQCQPNTFNKKEKLQFLR